MLKFDKFIFLNEQSNQSRKFSLGKLEGVEIFLEALSRRNLTTDKEIYDYMFWKGGDSRKYVVVSINNFNIPFYISTGGGNKKYVEKNKWYPFLGYHKLTGWLNKGGEDDIRNYYNIEVLKEISEALNKRFGTNPETTLSREGKPWEKIYDMTEYTLSMINKNMKPVSKDESTPDILKEQIEIIRNELRKYFPAELVDKNKDELTKEFMKYLKMIIDDNLNEEQIKNFINDGRFPSAMFCYKPIFDFLKSEEGVHFYGQEFMKEPGKDYKEILKKVLNNNYADLVIDRLLKVVSNLYVKISI